MECKCGVKLRADNKSGLCQKHMIKIFSHQYYVNLRKQHKCLRCRADIPPIMIDGKEVFRQCCDNCRQKQSDRIAARTDEQKLKDREYRRKYQNTEKYKLYLNRPDIIEKRKAYLDNYNYKKRLLRQEAKRLKKEQNREADLKLAQEINDKADRNIQD